MKRVVFDPLSKSTWAALEQDGRPGCCVLQQKRSQRPFGTDAMGISAARVRPAGWVGAEFFFSLLNSYQILNDRLAPNFISRHDLITCSSLRRNISHSLHYA